MNHKDFSMWDVAGALLILLILATSSVYGQELPPGSPPAMTATPGPVVARPTPERWGDHDVYLPVVRR